MPFHFLALVKNEQEETMDTETEVMVHVSLCEKCQDDRTGSWEAQEARLAGKHGWGIRYRSGEQEFACG